MIFASVMLTSVMLAAPQNPFADTFQAQPSARTTTAGPGTDALPNSMDEHIEVFRQILRRKLNRGPINLTQAQGTTDAVTYYSGNLLSQRGYLAGSGDYGDSAIEGVYLPGYGVVFTTTLSGVRRDTKATETKPAGKPLSDWERTQKELRGEKVEPISTPTTVRGPSTRDLIAQVLADNGSHLSKLRDDERLTVVITFRDGGGQLSGTALNPVLGATGQSMFSPTLNTQPSAFGPVTTAAPALTPSQAGKHASSARDYEMLGDLHVKQQQHQAAVDTYRRALAQYEDEHKASPQDDQNQRLASIMARQAQALIALGKHDEAVATLQKAQALGDGKAKAVTPPKPTKPRLPGKMIVSATKRQLDQIAAGKMTIEEFRKATSVDEE